MTIATIEARRTIGKDMASARDAPPKMMAIARKRPSKIRLTRARALACAKALRIIISARFPHSRDRKQGQPKSEARMSSRHFRSLRQEMRSDRALQRL